jgi:hypothetical protein
MNFSAASMRLSVYGRHIEPSRERPNLFGVD